MMTMSSLRSFRSIFHLLCVGIHVLFQGSHAYHENDVHVHKIDTYERYEEITKGDGIWMLEFVHKSECTPECDKLASEFTSLAILSRGIFNIGVIDASTEDGQRISQDNAVATFPTFLTYSGDGEKAKKYDGIMDTQNMMQEIMETTLETLRKRAGHYSHPEWETSKKKPRSTRKKKSNSKIVDLTSDNFQEMVLDNPTITLVAFTAPWCGHCKNLRPVWEDAANQLERDGAVIGWLDATIENDLAKQYGVTAYPTIKAFRGVVNDTLDDVLDYNGERNAPSIVSFVLEQMDGMGLSKDVVELTDMAIFETECHGKNHICVLAALPHILDSGASGRNTYRDTMKAVSKKFRTSSFSFLWFEGTAQPKLENGFELTFGFPALVAYSMDRGAYAVMRGSFSEKSISGFLHSITSGRQGTLKIAAVPSVVTVDAWDGEDGKPIEEELSLEEIMGWEDEQEL